MEKGIARVEPAKGRQDRRHPVAKLRAGGGKKFADRYNSVGPNKSVDLHPERDERDQKNQTENAQKPSPRDKISRRANVVAPEKARDRRSEPAIKSDDSVKAFRNGRKTRNMIVTPGQPLSGNRSALSWDVA